MRGRGRAKSAGARGLRAGSAREAEVGVFFRESGGDEGEREEEEKNVVGLAWSQNSPLIDLTDGPHGVQQVSTYRSSPQARPRRPHGLAQAEHGRRDARIGRRDGPDRLVGSLGEPREVGAGDVEGRGPRDAVDALALAAHFVD